MKADPAATLSSESNVPRDTVIRGDAKRWPVSFDWALLYLRTWFGVSLCLKHGTEKALFFRYMAWNTADPLHIGKIPSHIIALSSDLICSLLVAIGLGTRWAALICWCTILTAWVTVKDLQYFGFGLKSDHGELIFLYLIAYGTVIITGPGRFSLDWKLSTEGFWPFQKRKS